MIVTSSLILLALLFFVTLGGVLITVSVHMIPVGGAPAAMAQATGVGTGTTQLAAGAGLTGLLVSVSVHVLSGGPLLSILLGGIGSAVMIAIVMLVSNIGYIYGVGIPLASGKAVRDPITKDRQDIYVSKGTEGHGIPTAAFVSGIAGGIIGGIGGSLIFISLLETQTAVFPDFSGPSAAVSGTIAIILAIALFFINAVIASYNIGGTIEGYYDPKFKKLPKAVIVSAVMTFVCGFMSLYIMIQAGGVL